jgi:hypothetical protein
MAQILHIDKFKSIAESREVIGNYAPVIFRVSPTTRIDVPTSWYKDLYGGMIVRPAILIDNPVSAAAMGSVAPVEEPEIEEAYTVESKTEVYSFIHKNPFLKPLLKEACTGIREAFPGAKVLLRRTGYSELEDLDHLTALIQIREGSPEEVFDQLSGLEKSWLNNLMDRARNKFLVDVEFV